MKVLDNRIVELFDQLSQGGTTSAQTAQDTKASSFGKGVVNKVSQLGAVGAKTFAGTPLAGLFQLANIATGKINKEIADAAQKNEFKAARREQKWLDKVSKYPDDAIPPESIDAMSKKIGFSGNRDQFQLMIKSIKRQYTDCILWATYPIEGISMSGLLTDKKLQQSGGGDITKAAKKYCDVVKSAITNYEAEIQKLTLEAAGTTPPPDITQDPKLKESVTKAAIAVLSKDGILESVIKDMSDMLAEKAKVPKDAEKQQAATTQTGAGEDQQSSGADLVNQAKSESASLPWYARLYEDGQIPGNQYAMGQAQNAADQAAQPTQTTPEKEYLTQKDVEGLTAGAKEWINSVLGFFHSKTSTMFYVVADYMISKKVIDAETGQMNSAEFLREVQQGNADYIPNIVSQYNQRGKGAASTIKNRATSPQA